jgi:lactate racemase
MPRPGFVHEVDRSTPPVLFWRGENFSLERLPADRSRVIYPPEPLPAIKDIDGAIRHALLHPHDQDPLPALLFPGMKLTIAFDDVSLPLPKMRRPDTRQRVIEAVLDLAAAAGVDDVHLIAALGLHRRMHEYELRHALGSTTRSTPAACSTNTTGRITTTSPSSAPPTTARCWRSTSAPRTATSWCT